MTLLQLKNELNTDTTMRGYAADIAAGNHVDVANKLNDKSFATGYKALESRSVLLWSAKTGTYSKLVGHLADNPNANIKHICRSALKIIDRDGTFLDLEEDGVMAMLDGLVAGTVFTEAEKASLLAYAAEGRSRAEVLWGRGASVSHSQVSEALAL